MTRRPPRSTLFPSTPLFRSHRRANVLDVRMRPEVVGIDTDRGVVHWHDLDADTEGTEPYDELVYATGSVPMRPPVEGIDAEGVYGVQVLDDGVALRAELDSGRVRRGGGVWGAATPPWFRGR